MQAITNTFLATCIPGSKQVQWCLIMHLMTYDVRTAADSFVHLPLGTALLEWSRTVSRRLWTCWCQPLAPAPATCKLPFCPCPCAVPLTRFYKGNTADTYWWGSSMSIHQKYHACYLRKRHVFQSVQQSFWHLNIRRPQCTCNILVHVLVRHEFWYRQQITKTGELHVLQWFVKQWVLFLVDDKVRWRQLQVDRSWLGQLSWGILRSGSVVNDCRQEADDKPSARQGMGHSSYDTELANLLMEDDITHVKSWHVWVHSTCTHVYTEKPFWRIYAQEWCMVDFHAYVPYQYSTMRCCWVISNASITQCYSKKNASIS